MLTEITKPAAKDILGRIAEVKSALSQDLLVFAHFYQSDAIVPFADFVGDSLQLANEAARQRDKKFLVVCAVSFMAEMVRILCDPSQIVLHPHHGACCPLAEMASERDVERVWARLAAPPGQVIPIVYVNSTSYMKAFCGRHGGVVCTSSNASMVFQWALNRGARILFFPDENLGRNTARKLGIEEDEIFLVDPLQWAEDSAPSVPARTRVYLWKGFCYVHKDFVLQQIWNIKARYEDVRIAVHPECVPDVCNAADLVGATSAIKTAVEKAQPGSRWAIGTEWNLVHRLQKEHPDKTIIPIEESRCREMAMIEPEGLLAVLEGILRGQPTGVVEVPEDVSHNARIALQRMLEIA